MRSYFVSLLASLSILIYSAQGLVEVTPSEVASVCQAGDQLELTCSTTGMFHRWEVTVMIPQTTNTTIAVFTSIGPSGVHQPVTINSSTFTISRLSGDDSLPLISRMTVNPVSGGLNGAVVRCFEGSLSTVSFATTIIRIIDPGQFDLSVQSHSEVFSGSGVTVTLEWILLNSLTYYQQLLRNVSVEVDPPLSNVMFTGNMRAQLTLSYNTLYNVSVTQHSICQQLIRTKALLLNFSRCSNPMELTNALAVDYEDPTLEGQNISFTCRPGQMLNGSNSSTCMGNGEWEPDPRAVTCTGTSAATGATLVTTTAASCSSPPYVLQISDSVRVIRESARREFDDIDIMCCSGFLITNGNTTTCLENGEWELDTSQTTSEGMTVAMLRTALISATCVLAVISLFTFIAGIVCGHYLSQSWRSSADRSKQPESHQINPENIVSDLELKENVAYITLRPTT